MTSNKRSQDLVGQRQLIDDHYTDEKTKALETNPLLEIPKGMLEL